VRTDDSARNAYLHFRTPATLALSGNVASGTVGASRVAIHGVVLSGGAPHINTPEVGYCWDSNAYGKCAKARFASTEYAVMLPGPKGFAVHVIDALGASDAPATTVPMSDPAIDAAAQNGGVLGTAITRGGARSYVLAANGEAAPATMTYAVPGDVGGRHVVFDAPEDANGASSVNAAIANGRCVVTITAGGAGAIVGRPLIFRVDTAANGCAVNGAVPAPTSGTTSGTDGTSGPASAGTPDGPGESSGPSQTPGASGAPAGNGVAPAQGAVDGAASADAGGCNATGSRAIETWEALLAIVALSFLLRARRGDQEQAR